MHVGNKRARQYTALFAQRFSNPLRRAAMTLQ